MTECDIVYSELKTVAISSEEDRNYRTITPARITEENELRSLEENSIRLLEI